VLLTFFSVVFNFHGCAALCCILTTTFPVCEL
jgi:hypothetical protein